MTRSITDGSKRSDLEVSTCVQKVVSTIVIKPDSAETILRVPLQLRAPDAY